MNIAGFSKCDLANGPGARVSVFVSGCTLKCKGCFSQYAWDFNYGVPYTEEFKEKILAAVANKHVTGLSILGGDPLEPENLPEVLELCKIVKERFPEKTIWVWTGRIKRHVIGSEILKYIDVIKCGPFIEHLKGKYKYYGSSNQELLDAKTMTRIVESADTVSESADKTIWLDEEK